MNVTKLSAFAIAVLAGCFPKTSERYVCSETPECDDGRLCEGGFCVIPSDGGGIDGMTGDADDPCRTFGSRHFDACMIPRPSGPMTLTTAGIYIFNTNDGTLLDPGNVQSTPPSMVVNEMRVISVASFSLAAGATLRINGLNPLVVASWGTLEVAGTIDVSSSNTLRGAGAAPTALCAAHVATAGQNGGGGGGGGGGGTLYSNGGGGGEGGGGQSNGGNGAIGLAAATPLLSGGCSGEKGGNDGGNTGGNGGVGGGAVQLTAKTSITIASTGRINAGGSGGRQGPGGSGGGGGGGAGGMIGLEAPSLTIMPTAILAANGGGGGQGGGNSGGTPQAGQDGQLSAVAATGGTAGSGGDGGAGSISATAALAGANDGAGGGGGGGGAGYITVKAATRNDSGATFSPVPITIQ